MSHLGYLKTGKKEEVAERRAKVLALRKTGMSHRDIAKIVGCNHRAVGNDLKKILAELARETRSDAESVRELELQRLDTALEAIMPRVREGDLKAVLVLVRISESRRKLLGLDADQTSGHTVGGPMFQINVVNASPLLEPDNGANGDQHIASRMALTAEAREILQSDQPGGAAVGELRRRQEPMPLLPAGIPSDEAGCTRGFMPQAPGDAESDYAQDLVGA